MDTAVEEEEGEARPRWWQGLLPRRKRTRIALAVVVVLVAAVGIASSIGVGDFAIVPGNAQKVAPLITVPPKHAQPHAGSVYLTDVNLVQLNAANYLYYRLDPNASLVPTGTLTGTADISTYNQQGEVDMATAEQAATVVALQALGYPVHADPAGAIVYQLEQPSAVTGVLDVGDVIVSLAGHPVTTLSSLAAAVEKEHPGSKVGVVTHRLGSARLDHDVVTLGEQRVVGTGENATPACVRPTGNAPGRAIDRNGAPVPCLGIYLEQAYITRNLPFPVNINSEGIIGPSAGLAFTLGLIEKLDPKDLTAGHEIGATGTMSVDGSVGDVGGVAQKTVAVERAGVSVFFVPVQEYKTALDHANKSLKVYAVSSLSSALSVLEHLGGELASPTDGQVIGSPK